MEWESTQIKKKFTFCFTIHQKAKLDKICSPGQIFRVTTFPKKIKETFKVLASLWNFLLKNVWSGTVWKWGLKILPLELSSAPPKGRITSESLATLSQSRVCRDRLHSAEFRLVLAAIPIELSNMQQKSQDDVVSGFGRWWWRLEEKSGKASEEMSIESQTNLQSPRGWFHDDLRSKVPPPQGCTVPLLVGRQTKYSGGQIQFVGLPLYVPYYKGGTGGILGNQTTSTKTQNQGQVCLRKVQKCGQLVAVFQGVQERRWQWLAGIGETLENYCNQC